VADLDQQFLLAQIARRGPWTDLSLPRADREPVLFGETQALGSRSRPVASNAGAPGPVARLDCQSVSPVASLSFLEDVNRAKLFQNPSFAPVTH
jgi:hypothetical protein